ncbi:uncharacterized protein PHACADRAFT_210247 [Phanerochaete carnosa HHB-10118-sp]|uniref:Helicase ATP-binding domain-containing protein n=1 Tax=Phanerochaete carnosa (strain HHB-10118-sp) TaxID=650164 RepID=K5VSI3_PHACS|nr:uncharacterized protein PHACADRAFT_210247 [Phanerochaete carnosa HHB-10118-sp]EKM54448.1 hypothetical protein PHACADRAFT_210247 [Phanerochaete carnosa HHB-10118-sp]
MSQLVFIPTGGGKTALFYIPILIVLYMHDHPHPRFKTLPLKPVALVVVPLNELGNDHVNELRELGIDSIASHAEELERVKAQGRNVYKTVSNRLICDRLTQATLNSKID